MNEKKQQQVVQGGLAPPGSLVALSDGSRLGIGIKTKKKSRWRLLTPGSLS
jgi:hypothetical protein